jgi:hypothetical protein
MRLDVWPGDVDCHPTLVRTEARREHREGILPV